VYKYTKLIHRDVVYKHTKLSHRDVVYKHTKLIHRDVVYKYTKIIHRDVVYKHTKLIHRDFVYKHTKLIDRDVLYYLPDPLTQVLHLFYTLALQTDNVYSIRSYVTHTSNMYHEFHCTHTRFNASNPTSREYNPCGIYQTRINAIQ